MSSGSLLELNRFTIALAWRTGECKRDQMFIDARSLRRASACQHRFSGCELGWGLEKKPTRDGAMPDRERSGCGLRLLHPFAIRNTV
jgi:hypothetical protein